MPMSRKKAMVDVWIMNRISRPFSIPSRIVFILQIYLPLTPKVLPGPSSISGRLNSAVYQVNADPKGRGYE
jgi:hypothetical protein